LWLRVDEIMGRVKGKGTVREKLYEGRGLVN